MKTKRFITLLLAVVFVISAFAPCALAITYAPTSWSQWPLQKTTRYDPRYTKAIQTFLTFHQNSNLTADGIYGSTTCARVGVFQDDNNLDVDGKVGTATWSKMYSFITIYRNWDGGELMSIPSITEIASTNSGTILYYVKKPNGGTSYSPVFKQGNSWLVQMGLDDANIDDYWLYIGID